MSRKSYLEQAGIAVPEFKTLSKKFYRKYTIAGKSESCTRNYLMQISKMVLHFKCSPLELSVDQMEEYLFLIRQNEKPSMSSFKHLVYGLRTLFSMFKNERLFLEHIIPPHFRRIRHLGFLSTRSKKQSLEQIRECLQQKQEAPILLSRAEILEQRFGKRSQLKCRECGGNLQLLETFPKDRAPPLEAASGLIPNLQF